MIIIVSFIYVVICGLIGLVGSGRNIGYWGAFFIALLLSPLIGLIVALVSGSKKQSTPIINNIYQQPAQNQQQYQQQHYQQTQGMPPANYHQQHYPQPQQIPATNYQQPNQHQAQSSHPTPEENKYAQLEKLAEMKQRGILSDEEFQREKDKLLKN